LALVIVVHDGVDNGNLRRQLGHLRGDPAELLLRVVVIAD
jgi:hypothetical protein